MKWSSGTDRSRTGETRHSLSPVATERPTGARLKSRPPSLSLSNTRLRRSRLGPLVHIPNSLPFHFQRWITGVLEPVSVEVESPGVRGADILPYSRSATPGFWSLGPVNVGSVSHSRVIYGRYWRQNLPGPGPRPLHPRSRDPSKEEGR